MDKQTTFAVSFSVGLRIAFREPKPIPGIDTALLEDG
jgi:hypothetical protein